MSLGGAAIGFTFGLGLLIILFQLDRRFSREENIVEVVTTFAAAYLGYYVAEVFFHTCKYFSSGFLPLFNLLTINFPYSGQHTKQTAGVIATVACAVTVKALGKASLNDTKLLDSFWSILEHILNTILCKYQTGVQYRHVQ